MPFVARIFMCERTSTPTLDELLERFPLFSAEELLVDIAWDKRRREAASAPAAPALETVPDSEVPEEELPETKNKRARGRPHHPLTAKIKTAIKGRAGQTFRADVVAISWGYTAQEMRLRLTSTTQPGRPLHGLLRRVQGDYWRIL